jgi:hypothetical protein
MENERVGSLGYHSKIKKRLHHHVTWLDLHLTVQPAHPVLPREEDVTFEVSSHGRVFYPDDNAAL